MRKQFKRIVQFFALVIASPLLLIYYISSLFLSKDALFPAYSQLLSMLPGKIGSYVRVAFYSRTMTHCSVDVSIGFATIFSQIDTEIHELVYIGPQCNIGKCKIDKNTLIGSGVHILSGKNQHNYEDINIPIREQGGTFVKINIGADSWIGNSSVVMANVADKTIVAAGSIVVENTEKESIVAGNPAKKIKQR